MADPTALPLKVVDGLALDAPYREVLRPGALTRDADGYVRRLPRFFYEVDSWRTARETTLAPNFGLYEFINVDVYEAEVLRAFPRYLPCAAVLLATSLALLRQRLGTYVHIAANGAYRSPAHARSREGSPHHWGTAANIYRIGDDYMEDQETIERYRALIREVLPTAWLRPYGHTLGFANDHLHVDLGYTLLVPHGVADEATPESNALPAPNEKHDASA